MSDNWATPAWILALLPPNYYDPCPRNGSGGLDEDWPTDRTVYVNPPYSDPAPWVRKAALHRGRVILLVKLDPSTEWWSYSTEFKVYPVTCRLRFENFDSGGKAMFPAQSANFGSAVWVKEVSI